MNQRAETDPLRRRLVAAGLSTLLLPRAMASDPVEAVLADAGSLPPLRAVLVARHGALVAERYYGDASAGQLRRINSATKSVVSMLVGQALVQGRLSGLSQTVAQLLPDQVARAPDSPAAQLTLRQILTGTTGLAYDFTRDMDPLARARDPVQHVLALPRNDAPAGSWSYNDAAISLLAPILERAYGMKLPEIARQGLFAPLGIESFHWRTDRSGQATSYMGLGAAPARLYAARRDGGRWRPRHRARGLAGRQPEAAGGRRLVAAAGGGRQLRLPVVQRHAAWTAGGLGLGLWRAAWRRGAGAAAGDRHAGGGAAAGGAAGAEPGGRRAGGADRRGGGLKEKRPATAGLLHAREAISAGRSASRRAWASR
ncbi:serine hydrolase domain-containing protein [Ramlibacter montanisoli]|uniref:Beta-lactamase family protein n=1 Tax=Ramlibacter montanisoli TaxID=2732512 RepID=A0A849KB10_9BURK|nr:serine hydrolase domain-containing protein [Ramlibacter montanisoli]NNU42225.1 beta-lactamase family protein [Ramlibacter montanisoli]